VSVTAPVVVLPIGTVQGTGDASPYIGQTVTVDGVVTEKTYDSSSGHGFFLQSTPGTGDADTATSDGIWVYLGGYTTLIGGYTPVVGDEIAMSGKVSEYYDQTEIGSARLVSVVAHDQSVDPFVADPPAETAAAHEYWESHEGMLALVPEGSLVDSPRHIYASSSDSEFYVIRSDTTVGQRSDPFARRVFRDAHPLDDLPPLVDNGNAYSILITDAGVKALTGDLGTFLPPVRTFDTLSADLLGGVSYAYGSYSVAASGQPQVADGVDPSTNAPPTAFDRAKAYSIANYNVENLYDYRDDPTDGCDFAGNAGCTNVLPPFDYVPASDAEYQSRLAKIAHQVVDDLHAPDVIAVAEAEDQDICTVRDGALACDASDGKPDVLQELATRIAEFGGPAYDAAFDRDGADDRGIVSAFLYRTDRVQLLPAFSGPDVQYRGDPLPYDADVQNPKAMNAVLPSDVDTSTGVDGSNVYTRAPEVGHFRIWRTAVGLSEYRDVWVIADHFSSTPDARVGQRREQAAYNAAIEQAILAAEPGAKVAVAGDLNVYPRPDDTAPPSDQLAPLYDAGMHNLFDTLVELHPSSAYSYVYMGQAQTLDQQFDSPALFADLLAVNVAHVNSDWSLAEGNRGTSDHDPMVARYDGRATLAGLRQLVLFYAGSGQLNALAERGLLDRLDRAAAFRAAGLLIPYATQLRSFAQDATHGVPGQIDPAAGAALAAEAAAVLAG
jgi:predicted extracellular nuclease